MPWWLWLVGLAILWAVPLCLFGYVIYGAIRDEMAERRGEWIGPVEDEMADVVPIGWPDRYAGTRPRPHAGGRFGQDGNPRA